ncbi:MAG: DUF3109 family protein [Bacteroidales bacterium]|nr:DUF3109 family protein [Bacteroidales bacterium]
MIEIGKTLISSDLVDKKFICDYKTCKGICCLEGDSGAPITPEEDQIMKKALPHVLKYLSEEAKALIEEKGISYIDIEDDLVTTINNGKECVFTHFTADGSCRCSYEMAFEAGDIDFPKPISCALYPVRVKQYKDFVGINYDEWDICKCAEVLGEKMGTPVYKFLEKPLIRRFGQPWYTELKIAAKQLQEARDAEGQ